MTSPSLKELFLCVCLISLTSCLHMRKKIGEEVKEIDTFTISEGSLVYIYAQPINLSSILSKIPGIIPFLAAQNLESLYFDYSPPFLQGKALGQIPQQWINAILWERRESFDNHSTLHESRYKIKSSNLYLTLVDKKMVYISSTGFYSKDSEKQATNQDQKVLTNHKLVDQSRKFPFFLRLFNIQNLLVELKVKLPSIIRLPFDELEASLTLEDHIASLDFSFTSHVGTPPALAVRFALNYILGQYPSTPLSKAWKNVPITINPNHPSQVQSSILLTQEELNESLRVIASAYYEGKTSKIKEAKKKTFYQEKRISPLL